MKIIVDVSHYQKIDWSKFHPDGVIMKATQGTTFVDPTFKENQKQARKKGLLTGFYHFAQPSDAKKEAQFFLRTIGELLEGEFIVLDWEVQFANYAVWCMDFCRECERICGVFPIMYMNSSTANKAWTAFKGRPLWVASYGINSGNPGVQPQTPNWKQIMWQYTSNGTTKGISTRVDLSQTKEDLRKYGKIKALEASVISTPTEVPPIVEKPAEVKIDINTSMPEQETIKLSELPPIQPTFWQQIFNFIISLLK